MRSSHEVVTPDLRASHPIDPLADASRTERDHWIHDFRNALGNTTIAASAIRGVLEQQRYEQVEMLMRQIEEGCERCMRLLGTMPR